MTDSIKINAKRWLWSPMLIFFFCRMTIDIAVNIIRLMAMLSTLAKIDKLSAVAATLIHFLFLCRAICRVLVVYYEPKSDHSEHQRRFHLFIQINTGFSVEAAFVPTYELYLE